MSRALNPSRVSGGGVAQALNRLVVARGGVGNFFSEVRAPEDQRDQEGGLSQGPPSHHIRLSKTLRSIDFLSPVWPMFPS